MILELSEEEFKHLLTLASVGERVRNDWIPEQHWSPEQRHSADLLSDLCTRAANTRSADLVAPERTTGDWMPSRELEEETDCILRNYDEEVFWGQLVERCARRDLVAEYGEEALDCLAPGHYRQAEDAMLEYYEKEIDVHGLGRFVIDERKQTTVRAQQWHNVPDPSIEKARSDLE